MGGKCSFIRRCSFSIKCALTVVSVLFLMAGCGAGNNSVDTGASEEDDGGRDYDFIFVCPAAGNEYWRSCIEGIKKADAELGTRTKVIGPRTAENFANEIVRYMKQAVDEKPDGIMAYAGVDGMYPLIEEAADEGIPVLALDSDAPSTSRIAYVGTGAYSAGYEAGRAMVELTGGNARVGVMVSSKSAGKEMEIMNAFRDAVDDYGIEIAAVEETDASTDVAEKKAEAMLKDYPDMNAVFGTTGHSVAGAARVKRNQGLDDLVLVGFDDVSENLENTREGVINALFVQRIEQIGYQGVCLMKEYIDRGGLPKDNYDTGIIRVDRENVDTYSTRELTTEENGKTVRVGYYSGDTDFQDGFINSVRKSGYAYEYYQAIANLTGWEYEYIYGSRREILDMLQAGGVDIVAGVYKTDNLKDTVLFAQKDMGIENEKRYFAVSRDRDDILEELDYATEQLLQYDPGFTANLWQKYYGRTAKQMLSDREKEWLADKGVLRIGYVRHNLPFSDQDEDGGPTGVISDIMDILEEFLRIIIEPVCYENVTELEQGIENGEIDAAFPIYSDLWLSESKGLRQTDSFISDRVMIIYNGEYTNDLVNRIALSVTGIGQRYYIANYYPDSEVVFYDTRDEAFDAVSNGRERCIIGAASIMQRFLKQHPEYNDLNIAYMDNSENFGMAVNGNNSLLTGILNKAVRQIDEATVTVSILRYSGVNVPYSLIDFVREHVVIVVAVFAVFFAILLCVFISYWRRTISFNIKQAETRKELEKALNLAKEANEAKTAFLSSMSHDIRTPMNAVVGMTFIASKYLDDKERVKDCLNKISLSSHHLLALINDILDISKIESGKLKLNPAIFSIRDTVNTIVDIVQPQIQEKNMEFEVYLHGIDYEVLYADELRLKQIFINILSNAIKYTPDKGRVVMHLSQDALYYDQMVRVTYVVEDNGIGMSEEFMENMYDTFSRAEDRRTNNIQGTGLGLSIVRQMVEMMGGTIECASKEGKGTKFTVVLDLHKGNQGEDKLALSDISLLLVDEDKMFLEDTSDMFRDMDADVKTAYSRESALEIVRSMDVGDGKRLVAVIGRGDSETDCLETVKAMREIMGEERLTIFISAYDRDIAGIEDEAVQSGVDGFIVKPVFRSAAYEKIQGVLYGGSENDDDEIPGASDLKGLHILVAEDNEFNWEVISELLSLHGMTAECAVNGKICVDMLREAESGTYDLVLMDIQMPVMDGREAARIIRKDEDESVRNIPIIAMTADAFAEDIEANIEAGMNGHASKPVDMNKLIQEMRKVLSSTPPGRN